MNLMSPADFTAWYVAEARSVAVPRALVTAGMLVVGRAKCLLGVPVRRWHVGVGHLSFTPPAWASSPPL